jgi:hypothetical protein
LSSSFFNGVFHFFQKEKKKEVDITILHLTKLQKTPKKKIKILKLNSRTKWIYEPTFGRG